MDDLINRLLDRLSDFLGRYPGILPLAGVGMILVNLLLQIIPGPGSWLVDSNLLLHIGAATAIIGLLLMKPLG